MKIKKTFTAFLAMVASTAFAGATPHVLPADPQMAFALWNLHNYGQAYRIDPETLGQPGKSGADINILGAWKIVNSAPDVLVAVIDGGFDLDHPDVKSAYDREDAFNVLTHSSKILPPSDPVELHGGLVTGVIAANGFNAIGITGVTRQTRVLPIEAVPRGWRNEQDEDIATAIDWAVTHGTRVINCSFGKYSTSPQVREAIRRAQLKNVLLVAAAGNDGVDLRARKFWPASYADEFDNVISVEASDRRDQLWSSSNKGGDIAAPGHEILSTGAAHGERLDRYFSTSGTSLAAPHVTGVAALMIQLYPAISAAEVKKILMTTAKRIPDLSDLVDSGRLDGAEALRATLQLRLSRETHPCEFENQRIVMHRADNGYTAFWTLNETPELLESYRGSDPHLTAYRSWVRAHTSMTARQIAANHLNILFRAGSDIVGIGADKANSRAVIDGEIGAIRPMNCLESIPFREFLKVVDLRKNAGEARAVVLRKDGQVKILGDFYFTPDNEGTSSSPASQKEEARLLSEGWELWVDYHNHPFDFANPYGDYGGETAPSEPDILMYQTEKPKLAVITNGVESIEMRADDIARFKVEP